MNATRGGSAVVLSVTWPEETGKPTPSSLELRAWYKGRKATDEDVRELAAGLGATYEGAR